MIIRTEEQISICGDIAQQDADTIAADPSVKQVWLKGPRYEIETCTLLNARVFAGRKDITLRLSCGTILCSLPEVELVSWEADEYPTFEPLYHLKLLRGLSLGLHGPKSKFDISFLNDFRQSLTDLRLTGDYAGLAVIQQLYHLRRLSFTSTKLPDLSLIQGLQLEAFGNYGSRIPILDALRSIPSMKHLWLKNNTKLENIDFICELRNLEQLDLMYISKLKAFPDCSHLTRLRSVTVWGCKRFDDIEGLREILKCEVNGR